MTRYLFIVSLDNPALFEFAKQRFANEKNITVILDRRVQVAACAPPVERRRQPEVSEEIRVNSYAIVACHE